MESSQTRHYQTSENTRDANLNQNIAIEQDVGENYYSDQVNENHDYTTKVKRDALGNILLHLIDPDAELASLDITKDEW